MLRKNSLTSRILAMVCITSVLICTLITVVGAGVIYTTTENSLKSEIETAAHTFLNSYDNKYHGEYYLENGTLMKGETPLDEDNFIVDASLIYFSSDIDFTIFLGDTRMLTTVKNPDGSYAVGTKCDPIVKEQVLDNGLEIFFSNVDVNGQKCIGCYIPVMDSYAQVNAIYYAGIPLDLAYSNVNRAVMIFIGISAAVLLIAILVCSLISHRIVRALMDIRGFMDKITSCDFSCEMQYGVTLSRKDEIGDIARSASTLRDTLRELIELDPLTCLLNRRSCRKNLEDMTAENKPFTVIMCDIDHFKSVNDTYGHSFGDAVLCRISSVLYNFCDACGGYASRWGGEEFLLVIPETDDKKVRSMLDGLLDTVRKTETQCDGKSVIATLTIGAAVHIENEPFDDTVNRADKKLYRGKNSGRNRIVM